jgi:hypothetical protein
MVSFSSGWATLSHLGLLVVLAYISLAAHSTKGGPRARPNTLTRSSAVVAISER